MFLNLWPSCLHLPGPGVTDVRYHASLCNTRDWAPRPYACWTNTPQLSYIPAPNIQVSTINYKWCGKFGRSIKRLYVLLWLTCLLSKHLTSEPITCIKMMCPVFPDDIAPSLERWHGNTLEDISSSGDFFWESTETCSLAGCEYKHVGPSASHKG